MPFFVARHPNHLNAKHPVIIDDLLEISLSSQDAVNSIVLMLHDFHVFGTNSRYAEKLKKLPLWELKTRARGGQKGGARVYFFVGDHNDLIVCNAEVKTGSTPNPQKLIVALQILEGYVNGLAVV
jgi:hypothetical protein